MVTKKAKTIPGKWGQKELIKFRKNELEKVEDEGVPFVPDVLVKRSIKKTIKKLKADKTYKKGKRYEKMHDEGWGKYEKGEHYATPTSSTKKDYKNKYKKKLVYV